MSAPVTHALILSAGLGTRLRPLTLVRAKPAIPVAGVPLIERIIRWLADQRVADLVLNLHYRPDTLAAIVGEGRQYDVRVKYSWESPEVLGSAGGPRLAAPIVGADPFFIVNGDTLTDLDLASLAAAHARHAPLVTMALVPNTEPDRYGGVRLDDRGIVTGFAPRGATAVGTFHFIGVQIAAAEAFASVTPGNVANSVGEVYDRLVAERPGSIRGYVCGANFWDIGSVADYWRTSVAFADRTRATLGFGAGSRADATAAVRHTIVWDRVTIGARASLDGCIVTDDVAVAAGAVYRDVILTKGSAGEVVVAARPVA